VFLVTLIIPLSKTPRVGLARWHPHWWLLPPFVAQAQAAWSLRLFLDMRMQKTHQDAARRQVTPSLTSSRAPTLLIREQPPTV